MRSARAIRRFEGLQPLDRVLAVEAGADEVLDEGLAQGQALDRRAQVQLVLLDRMRGLADAAVLLVDALVDAQVLGDAEEVGGHLAVVEEVEEALHVGEPALLGHLALFATVALDVVALARQDLAGATEGEDEAAELDVRRLVGGVDLEDGEVLGLVGELLDVVGQVDGGAFGGRAALLHPADALLLQRRDRLDADVGAGEGLAVQAQELADAREVDAGGEGLDVLLGAPGLEAEVGLAALDAAAKDVEADLVPQLQLLGTQALRQLGRRLHEGHRGDGRDADEAVGQLDQALVAGGLDVAQGHRALGEEGVGLASDAPRDARRHLQVVGALADLDALEEVGAALEVERRFRPRRVGDRGGELEEGHKLGVVQGLDCCRGWRRGRRQRGRQSGRRCLRARGRGARGRAWRRR